MMEQVTVVLALGANLGEKRANINQAVSLLGNHLSSIVVSTIIETDAAYVEDQPRFCNAALTGNTDLTPHELMRAAQAIEKEVGRTETFRWGPRMIDIDIIFYGDCIIKEDDLNIPHILYQERLFVLEPLVEVYPHFKDPQTGMTVQESYNDLIAHT